MLKKGDFKFRLQGQRLKGDFALIHISARRPGSKGNEWLLIKKQTTTWSGLRHREVRQLGADQAQHGGDRGR